MLQHPDPKVQAMINEVAEQRNVALDNLAVARADLTDANAQLAAARTEITQGNEAVSTLAAKVRELQTKLDTPDQA
jgi:hypothetical protein